MRKVVLVLALFSSLSAVEYKIPTKQASAKVPDSINFPYAMDYILIGKGLWNEDVERIVSSDSLFVEANGMLNDPKNYISKTVPLSLDPESAEKGMTQRNVADFNGAIKKLSASAKTYQNPVSAYEATQLSMKHFGKGANSPIYNDMHVLSKLLFKYEVCDGYLLYGEQLEKSGNATAAYEVFKKGMENTKCTGWYQSVLGGKISVMKRTISK